MEGGNHNDWTEWEKTAAARLARSVNSRTHYGQGPTPVWPEIREAAKTEANYISGRAAEHYERYESDLKLAAKLGLTAYRFSVEWARIEPEPGAYDEASINHYIAVAKTCREQNQEPFVTLWHFTLPVWAAEMGGWASDTVVERFAAYARRMGEALRPYVSHIATLNEPEVYGVVAYLMGIWPPQRRSPSGFGRVRRGMVQAHRLATHELKLANPAYKVGFCTSQAIFPASDHVQKLINDYFVHRLAGDSDWMGVQYYVKRTLGSSKGALRSDLGWELHPEGHYEVLKRLARYGKPLYVTESGLADAKDRYRAWYIEESLGSIAQATGEGVDCRGYFHWSLLDNFEWHEGFWPKFGLIEVDRDTMERRVRPSAEHYAELIRQYQSFGE